MGIKMTKYANIVDNRVFEIVDTDKDIKELYHPSLVFVEVDSKVKIGDVYDGKTFKPFVIEKSQDDKIAEQYAAINDFVKDTIKKGHDYDSFEETRAWYDDDEFRIEAKAVNAWCRQCFKIQADIKSGVKKYDSVEAVIADLPKYEILA